MAKRNRCDQSPQARHKNKSTPSQHDRQGRLLQRNKDREKTRIARIPLVGLIAQFVEAMQSILDSRMASRFSIIMAGVFLAKGRRTASAWFRSAGVRDDWDCFYDALTTIGRFADSVSRLLIQTVFRQLGMTFDGLIHFAIDDSPTRRCGRKVEGANIHHNPTPGPGDGDWVYGHNWVWLAWLQKHFRWGVIGLPILSRLYVRKQDISKLDVKYGWEFRTKIELAIELMEQFVGQIRWLAKEAKFRVSVDCAYATKQFLKAAMKQNVTVVSRLRKNARLFDLPPSRTPGQRGRGRKYGMNRLVLSDLACDPMGWESMTYNRRRVETTCRFKTFLATNGMATKPIQVILVSEDGKHWAAFFSTDPTMEAKDILETASSRWAIEECFHDLKEVWRSGEQQVRNVWSNLACWQMNAWAYTLTELVSWNESEEELVDRRDRPWDNEHRRPSHADRRRWISGKMLKERYSEELQAKPNEQKLRELIEELMALAA